MYIDNLFLNHLNCEFSEQDLIINLMIKNIFFTKRRFINRLRKKRDRSSVGFKHMKMKDMYNLLRYIVVLFLGVGTFSGLSAYDDSPKCLREFETDFFPYDILSEALSMSFIGQSQWTLIYDELKRRNSSIIDQVKAAGRQMRPDPFENPFDPEQAEKVLMQVLFKEFNDVLVLFNVANPLTIRSAFEYIRRRQAPRLKNCLQSEARQSLFNKKPMFNY